MATIFLSYAREDMTQVEPIYKYLTNDGHTVWFDRVALYGGLPFVQEIEMAVQSADFFILAMTKNSLHSKFVHKELMAYMLREEKRENSIVPLKFDDTTVSQFSIFISDIQECDFRNKQYDAGMLCLRRALAEAGAGKGAMFNEEEYKRFLFAIDLAIQAGNTAMMFYNNSLADNLALDTRKNAATEADHAAERKIVPLIQSDYPQDSIVSEEDKSQLNARIQKDGYTWIIDPLDGTNNFVNQIPFFCSSVAVMKDRKPFIGVIYEPVLNQVYYAIQGMHSQVWRVSTGETRLLQADRQVQTLSESLLATHISARAPVTRELFDDKFFLNLSLNFKHVRSFGSGLLALAYVAVGRLNTFMQIKSHLWDQAAGVVIVENAGGIVREFSQPPMKFKQWNYRTKNIIACSNEALLKDMEQKLALKK